MTYSGQMDANSEHSNVRARQASATAPHRTQADRREESQRRMLQAAAALIGQNGIRGTSLAEVGIRAGYSRGLPVERYQTKLGMVQALLDDMDSWMTKVFDDVTRGVTGADAVTALVGAHVASARHLPEGTAAFHAIRHEARFGIPELRAPVEDMTRRWRSRLAVHIREAQTASQFRSDIDATVQARAIIALISESMRDEPGEAGGDKLARDLLELIRRLFAHADLNL